MFVYIISQKVFTTWDRLDSSEIKFQFLHHLEHPFINQLSLSYTTKINVEEILQHYMK